uniref:Variant surface glycoprotein 1125.73 n=1 Tax=Trypanosoma brucei TaxID=5691 RepID=A0A1J0R457_9TRYP|nr:variant surface glycoprotein 1125.73 [Trypanosoma brucei]
MEQSNRRRNQLSTAAVYLVAAAAATAVLTTKSSASNAAFDETGIKKLCAVATALTKVASVVNYRYKQIKLKLEAAEEAAFLATAAASDAADDNISMVYAAAAAAARSCTAETANEIAALAPAATKATANANKAAGAIAEFADFLRKISQGGNAGYCLGTDTAVTTAKTIEELGCPHDFLDKVDARPSWDEEELGPGGYTKLTTAELKLTGGGSAKCILTKQGTTTTDVWQAGATEETTLAGGFIKITPHATKGSEKINIATLNDAQNWAFQNPTTAAHKVFNSLGELRQVATSDCPTDVTSLLQHVIKTGRVQAYLGQALAIDQQTTTPAQITAQAKNMIDKLEPPGPEQAAQIVAKIRAQSITIPGPKGTEAKKLSDRPSGDEQRLATLLSHMRTRSQVTTLRKELEEARQSKNTKDTNKIAESDETCEKKGTGDNCKDGCKVEGEGANKKCVKDPTYKTPQTEGGEKESKTGTTNTTGSNSFVIKTSPLLLAFLLF